MPQTKIYGVDGKREAIMMVPLGNGRNEIQVTFKRGNDLRGANYRPATYACADKTEQLMIESSMLFKTGVIRLVRVIGTADPVPGNKKTINNRRTRVTADSDNKKVNPSGDASSQNSGNAPGGSDHADNNVNDAPGGSDHADNNVNDAPGGDVTETVIDEVTTIEEARVALKARGANAVVLMNKSAMKNYMIANKIKFPNFNFEEKDD